ncbi:hypothetical protein [Leptospira wolffii]|uniref:hypothetical protein n=1 Tax=Leptospira wolffii TaxID=409998 RepID=UPI00058F01F9|nr:hypothetical protein [Leptospira wolffii]
MNVEGGQLSPENTSLFPKIGLIISIELLFAFLILPKIHSSYNSEQQSLERKYVHTFSIVLIVIGYVISFYRGFRLPNLWTMGYFVPSYFDGIYRRAFGGTFLYLFGELRFNYYFILGVQILIFLALNLLILKAIFKSSYQIRILFALFLLSPAGGYFFHEIGYIDQLLFLILGVAISLRNQYAAYSLIAISPLFHEEALIIVFPCYYLSFFFRESQVVSKWKWIYPIAFASLLFIIIVSVRSKGDAIAEFTMKWALNANYPPRFDYIASVLATKTTAFAALHYTEHQIGSLAITVFAGVIASFTASQHDFGKKQNLLFCVAILCASLPLSLGFIGWDTSRWIFLSLSASLLVFYLARKYLRGFLFYASVISIVLFSMQVRLRYFDGFEPRKLNPTAIEAFFKNDFLRIATEIPKL